MGKLQPKANKVWSVYTGNGGWIARDAATGKELLVVSSTTVAKHGFVVGESAHENWEAPNGNRVGLDITGTPLCTPSPPEADRATATCLRCLSLSSIHFELCRDVPVLH